MSVNDRYNDPHRSLADYLYKDLKEVESQEVEKGLSMDPGLEETYRFNVRVRDYLKAKIQLESMRKDPELEEAERLAEMVLNGSESAPGTEAPVESEAGPGAGSKDILSRRPKARMRWLIPAASVAAAAALIISLGVFGSGNTPEELFQDYYAPMDASEYTLRGGQTLEYSPVNEGIRLYLEGDYEATLQKMRTLSDRFPYRTEAQFYSGLSYLGLEQFELASEAFESVVQNQGRYLPEALWYLGLCQLQTGELEQSSMHLQRLSEYEGIYKEDALALLKDLRRFSK